MYSAEDYMLFVGALLLFWAVLAVLGAVIERRQKRREFQRFVRENQHKFQLPKRQGMDYRQEWEEVLGKIHGGRTE